MQLQSADEEGLPSQYASVNMSASQAGLAPENDA